MASTRTERLMENAVDFDAIVIANDGEPFLDSSFWYVTEQNSGCFESSYAVVRKDGSMDVIVNVLEEETARNGKGDVKVYHSRADLEKYFQEALKGCNKVGFNVHSASYASVMGIRKLVGTEFEIADASDALAKTYAIKDAKEIEATRKACRISSQVAAEIPDYLSEGVSEKEVAARMDARMRQLGGTGNAFDTIAAFGPNSSQPHYMPGDYRLKVHDAALFDFGSKYDRYCSDMTRTVFLGEPSDIMRRAYEVVLEAQTAGIEEYRAGANANAADLAARKIIDESEFKGKFIHSFGHGIGMDVHQPIHVSPRSEQILSAGNIVSAEPGIYIPGVGGIRIEDTILITENGCERLTSFPHELTIV
ncbi:MAG: Xaa-Pro peptidase family protein [archaeon]|nr:Xaa-Pro peptidase family protein [archaeon]